TNCWVGCRNCYRVVSWPQRRLPRYQRNINVVNGIVSHALKYVSMGVPPSVGEGRHLNVEVVPSQRDVRTRILCVRRTLGGTPFSEEIYFIATAERSIDTYFIYFSQIGVARLSY